LLIFCFSRSVPCAPAGAKNTTNANKMAKQIAPTTRLAVNTAAILMTGLSNDRPRAASD
jgi:hypothetical protein